MCGEITLKTKAFELSFPNTTSICPLPEKVKTKIALKYVKPTKHEYSMWEHVNKISTMVGSSGTPSVACKVDHDKRKTKLDHYMYEFPMSCNNTFRT